MKRPRITIARLMFAILVIALNAGLIRAFFEGMFSGLILLFFAMQAGLFLLLRSQGQARRFWVGFEVAGIAVVLALFVCELFPDSALGRCVFDYNAFAMDTVVESPHMPAPVADFLMMHPDLLCEVVCSPPELVMASLGGLLAMLVAPGLRRRDLSPNPQCPRCPQPSDVLTSNRCDSD